MWVPHLWLSNPSDSLHSLRRDCPTSDIISHIISQWEQKVSLHDSALSRYKYRVHHILGVQKIISGFMKEDGMAEWDIVSKVSTGMKVCLPKETRCPGWKPSCWGYPMSKAVGTNGSPLPVSTVKSYDWVSVPPRCPPEPWSWDTAGMTKLYPLSSQWLSKTES